MLFGLNIHKLLQWSYLVEAPEFNFRYDRQVLFYLIASFLICITLFILSRKKLNYIRPNRILFRSISIFLLLTDLFGVFIFISRIQGLPFFSMRIMFLIWFSLLLGGLIALFLFLVLRYPKILKKYLKNKLRSQYLPKKDL